MSIINAIRKSFETLNTKFFNMDQDETPLLESPVLCDLYNVCVTKVITIGEVKYSIDVLYDNVSDINGSAGTVRITSVNDPISLDITSRVIELLSIEQPYAVKQQNSSKSASILIQNNCCSNVATSLNKLY